MVTSQPQGRSDVVVKRGVQQQSSSSSGTSNSRSGAHSGNRRPSQS